MLNILDICILCIPELLVLSLLFLLRSFFTYFFGGGVYGPLVVVRDDELLLFLLVIVDEFDFPPFFVFEFPFPLLFDCDMSTLLISHFFQICILMSKLLQELLPLPILYMLLFQSKLHELYLCRKKSVVYHTM